MLFFSLLIGGHASAYQVMSQQFCIFLLKIRCRTYTKNVRPTLRTSDTMI